MPIPDLTERGDRQSRYWNTSCKSIASYDSDRTGTLDFSTQGGHLDHKAVTIVRSERCTWRRVKRWCGEGCGEGAEVGVEKGVEVVWRRV